MHSVDSNRTKTFSISIVTETCMDKRLKKYFQASKGFWLPSTDRYRRSDGSNISEDQYFSLFKSHKSEFCLRNRFSCSARNIFRDFTWLLFNLILRSVHISYTLRIFRYTTRFDIQDWVMWQFYCLLLLCFLFQQLLGYENRTRKIFLNPKMMRKSANNYATFIFFDFKSYLPTIFEFDEIPNSPVLSTNCQMYRRYFIAPTRIW